MSEWLGFGAKGLRVGGKIVWVTNLNDSGAGSLRACTAIPGRVVAFAIGGTIKLESPLEIRASNLLVAGQTAPWPGIEIVGQPIKIIDAHDVVLQHLEIREGWDGVSVQGSSERVVLDHLSISWHVDENLSTYKAVKNVTVSNCLISEALNHAGHPEGEHSCGALVGDGARNISFIRNLFAINRDRNIRWKFDTWGEMVNNLIYGWGPSQWNVTNLTDLENKAKPTMLDVVCNQYVPGPYSYQPLSGVSVYAEDKKASKGSKVYLKENWTPGSLTNLPDEFIRSAPLPGATTPISTNLVYELVLSNAGSRPWNRNSTDARVIGLVRAKKGVIVDTPPEDALEGDALMGWLRDFEGAS